MASRRASLGELARPVLPRRASFAGLVASATVCSVTLAAPLQQRSRRSSDSAVSYVQIVPNGCCRTPDSGPGTSTDVYVPDQLQCENACTLAESTCQGYEYQASSGLCELHTSALDFHHTAVSSVCQCVQKIYDSDIAWMTNQEMPRPLGEVASAVVGSSIYVIGQGFSNTYKYDISSDSWAGDLQVRPHPGNHHAMVVVGTDIYVIGAFDNGQGKLQIYNTLADSWVLGSNMPWNAEGSVAAVYMRNRIYGCGGLNTRTRQNAKDCFIFDPVSSTWTQFADMLIGVDHAAAGTDGAKLYVFGGRSTGVNRPDPGLDAVQVYDPEADVWIYSTPMPFGRGGTGFAPFAHGRFYVVGGETCEGCTSDPFTAPGEDVYTNVGTFDPATSTWSSTLDIPVGVHGIFPVYVEATNAIHVIGGGVVAGHSSSRLHQTLRLPAATTTTTTTTATTATQVFGTLFSGFTSTRAIWVRDQVKRHSG
eukprot:m.1091633 g.1091633  ORF g.1091633 m.1091633 type:complete len:478 (+) comp24290_c0_seq7:158-1591(+)